MTYLQVTQPLPPSHQAGTPGRAHIPPQLLHSPGGTAGSPSAHVPGLHQKHPASPADPRAGVRTLRGPAAASPKSFPPRTLTRAGKRHTAQSTILHHTRQPPSMEDGDATQPGHTEAAPGSRTSFYTARDTRTNTQGQSRSPAWGCRELARVLTEAPRAGAAPTWSRREQALPGLGSGLMTVPPSTSQEARKPRHLPVSRQPRPEHAQLHRRV